METKDIILELRTKGGMSQEDLAISFGVIIVASLIGLFFAHLGFSEANIITLYILGVLITSIITSSKTAWGFTSVASVLIFNFLFTKPRFTLMAYGDDVNVNAKIELTITVNDYKAPVKKVATPKEPELIEVE